MAVDSRDTKKRPWRVLFFAFTGILLLSFLAIFTTVLLKATENLLAASDRRHLAGQLEIAADLLEQAEMDVRQTGEDIARWESAIESHRDGKESLALSPPGAARLDFFIIQDGEGNVLRSDWERWNADSGDPSIPEVLYQGLFSTEESLTATNISGERGGRDIPDGRSGLYFQNGTPVLVAITPILPQGGGVPAGFVTTGRQVTDDVLGSVLCHEGALSMELRLLSEPGIPACVEKGSLCIEKELLDLEGNPISLLITGLRLNQEENQRNVVTAAILALLIAFSFAFLFYQLLLNRALQLTEKPDSVSILEDVPGKVQEKPAASRLTAFLMPVASNVLTSFSQTQYAVFVLSNILNSMDSFISVTDLDTDETLFLNDSLKNHYHLTDDALGQPCWEIFRNGRRERCDVCPRGKLQQDPEQPVVWEDYNPDTGRYYRKTDCMISWGEKGKAHLQQSVDITELKLAQQSLRQRLRQQELIGGIAHSFISPDQPDTLIDDALTKVGEFLDASKIVIASIGPDHCLHRKFAWANPRQEFTIRAPIADFRFEPGNVLHDAFLRDKLHYIACEDASTREEFDYLAKRDVKSFLIVPIHFFGKFWGSLTVDDCLTNRVWEESDIQMVRLLASVISQLISHAETEEELYRMSSIVDSSPQAIAYVSNDKLVYVNDGASFHTGYTREELQINGLFSLLNEEAYRLVAEMIRPPLLRGEGQSLEIPIIRKDGGVRTMMVSLFVTDEKNQSFGMIGHDITEKRRLEEELIVAKEEAERSSLAKGDFLSRMSHEMRTPMNAVIGMTQLARSAGTPEQKDDCLRKIDTAAKHLIGVINDILDISKIEAGKFKLSFSDFSVEKMLSNVAGVFDFPVGEKKLRFFIHLDTGVPASIISDELRLSQVITNLLSNAVKFTPEGGRITLSVRLLDEQPDGRCTLQFAVRDNGIGIARERQKKLFRYFEQGDDNVPMQFGGTGLGLAISKSLVGMLGGQIRVEAEEGKGSCFLFTLPTKKGSRPPDARRLASLESMRVLMVHPAQESREHFLRLAAGSGLPAQEAVSMDAACRLMDEGAFFDIVFVDWLTLTKGGEPSILRMKEQYGCGSIVAIISPTERAAVSGMDTAVDGFISKPLFASSLVDCVNRYRGLPTEPPPDAPSPESVRGRFRGYRILIVEDIDINREILAALLEPSGLELQMAPDGESAVRAFTAAPGDYDAILMDIHMPGIDGYEATRQIRRLESPDSRIPIIAMTANVFREDVDRCLQAGMDDHLGKPLDLNTLLKMLEKHLPEKE